MFDWKIWGTKWVKGAIASAAAAICFYTAEYLGASTLPANYVFWSGLGVTVLNQVGNYIKHTYLV